MDRYFEWRSLQITPIEKFDITNYNLFIYSLDFDGSHYNSLRRRLRNTKIYSEQQTKINILTDPYSISKKYRICTSFVTSKQFRFNQLFKRVGFILDFPIENIIFVGNGQYDKSNDELKNIKLLSPEDVIKGEVSFNEVIIEGTTEYGVVKPTAIFVDYTGIYNEHSQMDNNEWERDKTNLELEMLVKLTKNVFPIIDITFGAKRETFIKKLK